MKSGKSAKIRPFLARNDPVNSKKSKIQKFPGYSIKIYVILQHLGIVATPMSFRGFQEFEILAFFDKNHEFT